MEKQLNIYGKLTAARSLLNKREITKSGRNEFSKYDYYELSDYMPHIVSINEEVGLCSIVTFSDVKNGEIGILTLIDIENTETTLQFTMKLKDISLKACNAMQNEGAKHTFARRYLYIDAYELSESDPSEVAEQAEANTKTEEDLKKEKDKAIAELKTNCKKAGFTIMQVIDKYNAQYEKSVETLEDMPVKAIAGMNKLMLININKKANK